MLITKRQKRLLYTSADLEKSNHTNKLCRKLLHKNLTGTNCLAKDYLIVYQS